MFGTEDLNASGIADTDMTEIAANLPTVSAESVTETDIIIGSLSDIITRQAEELEAYKSLAASRSDAIADLLNAEMDTSVIVSHLSEVTRRLDRENSENKLRFESMQDNRDYYIARYNESVREHAEDIEFIGKTMLERARINNLCEEFERAVAYLNKKLHRRITSLPVYTVLVAITIPVEVPATSAGRARDLVGNADVDSLVCDAVAGIESPDDEFAVQVGDPFVSYSGDWRVEESRDDYL